MITDPLRRDCEQAEPAGGGGEERARYVEMTRAWFGSAVEGLAVAACSSGAARPVDVDVERL